MVLDARVKSSRIEGCSLFVIVRVYFIFHVCAQGMIDYGEAHKHITATLQTLISQVKGGAALVHELADGCWLTG